MKHMVKYGKLSMKNHTVCRVKDIVCIMLSFFIVFGCAYGCGNEKEKVNLSGTPMQKVAQAKDNENIVQGDLANDKNAPITLDWYINFSWYNTPWGDSVVSKEITDKTGVKINFISPLGNESEKLTAMITSGNLPDLITLDHTETQCGSLEEQGLVYSMDELADLYEPYWYKTVDEDIVNWYTRENGHIYGYPNFSYSQELYNNYDNIASNQTFLVRKDIYEALGSPDMTTPEGFETAVEKAVELYPEVDGEPLIPIGACEFTDYGNKSFDEYLCNFLAIPYERDGVFYDRFSDPELKRWLKAFRRMGADGYLSQDIFMDKRTLMEEKISKGRYFCMMFQRTDLANQEESLYLNDPESVYIAVDGPKNSYGDDYKLPGDTISGWTLTYVSKSCSDPEKAIELLTYMLSDEGQQVIWLGVEGKTWDYQNGEKTMKPEVYQMMNEDRPNFDRLYGADATYWMMMSKEGELKYKAPLTQPLLQMKEWTYPYLFNASAYDVTLSKDTAEAEMEEKIKLQWGKTLPKLLLAKSDSEFDEIYDSYISFEKANGIDRVLETKTELMKAAKNKLSEGK